MAPIRQPQPRKNPSLRTTQPVNPPSQRSRTALELTRAAARGEFALHQCADCGQFAYPPRDACPNCLSERVCVAPAPAGGTVLSMTAIQISGDPYFRSMPPAHQALIALDCGPSLFALARPDCAVGGRVTLTMQLDKAGQTVVYARPQGGDPDSDADPHWRNLVADPLHRRVLITDGRSPVALPLVKALMAAGAAKVMVGISEHWKPMPERAAFEAIENVTLLPLDLTDDQSVARAAADYAVKTEILIHTALHLRPGSLFAGSELLRARDAMEVSYFGGLRLARHFGPVMKSRGADRENGAVAWVNLLSIHAHLSWPGFAAYSATQAASLSLSQALRGELRHGGVRVIDVFSGPMDIDWLETLPPPKVAPSQLAAEIVSALKAGVEERWVGDVARDFRDRFEANAKAVERELWGK